MDNDASLPTARLKAVIARSEADVSNPDRGSLGSGLLRFARNDDYLRGLSPGKEAVIARRKAPKQSRRGSLGAGLLRSARNDGRALATTGTDPLPVRGSPRLGTGTPRRRQPLLRARGQPPANSKGQSPGKPKGLPRSFRVRPLGARAVLREAGECLPVSNILPLRANGKVLSMDVHINKCQKHQNYYLFH
jgi:hypothetical protein